MCMILSDTVIEHLVAWCVDTIYCIPRGRLKRFFRGNAPGGRALAMKLPTPNSVRNYKICEENQKMMAEHCNIFITRYRAFLFDMDGVVTDTMPIHLQAWKEAFHPYGIEVGRMDVYIREGQQSRIMAREIAEEKGKSFGREDLEKIVEEKGKIFDRKVAAHARAFDGVAETLRMLRGNGIMTALVTGSRQSSAKNVLKAAGVDGLFDVIVTGDDTEKGKPNPDPFLKAIEKLRLNRIDCIVVENAPLGIKAARAAEVDYVIAVATSLGREYLLEADDIMDSFSELEQCLARRFAAYPII